MMERIFQTSDLGLASYLKIKGYKIGSIKKVGNGKVLFGFIEQDIKQREADVFAYFNDGGGFLSYTNAMKDLKYFLANKNREDGTNDTNR